MNFAKFLFLAAGSLAFSASAQLNSTGGPSGLSGGKGVYGRGDTAFVEVNGYCMRTLNGGANWTKLSNGLGNFPYKCNPNAFAMLGNDLVMATNGAHSVFKTSDWGNTWTPYADSLSPTAIVTHCVKSGDRVFIAGNGQLPLSYTSSSISYWKGTTVGGIASAISVIGPDTIWATLGGKTYRTHDNGDTWTQIPKEALSLGGISATDYGRVGSRMLCIVDAGGSNSVFYSDDYGSNWTLATKGFPSGKRMIKFSDDEVYAVGYYAIVNNGLLSAVYKTTDRGVNWLPHGYANNGLNMARWKGGHLLVNGGGVYDVNDADTIAVPVPFPNVTLKSLEINASKVFGLIPDGLFSRAICGVSWT